MSIQIESKPNAGILVVAAGIERSGSTWLYNAIRYCYLFAGKRTYGAWIEWYDPTVEADVHVVKAHEFHDGLCRFADKVLTSRRDMRDIMASVRRQGWIGDSPEEVEARVQHVWSNQFAPWQPHSVLEIVYEEMIKDKPAAISAIAAALGLAGIDAAAVHTAVERLNLIAYPEIHPTTLLHPRHITDGGQGSFTKTLSAEQIAAADTYAHPLPEGKGVTSKGPTSAPQPLEPSIGVSPSLWKRVRHSLHPLRRSYVSLRANVIEASATTARLVRTSTKRAARQMLRSTITLETAGGAYQMLLRGHVAEQIAAQGPFEVEETEFVSHNIDPNGVFIDVGANAGYFSLLAAKLSPNVRVYAFEPSSASLRLLRDNIALNGLRNIEPVASALGASKSTGTLKINAPGLDGLNTLGEPTHPSCEIVGTETVPVITLDDFVEENGIERVAFIKIDTEGAELFVLQGAKSILTRPFAPIIMFECAKWTKGHGYEREDILTLLTELGYTLDQLTDSTMVARKPK